MMSTLTFGDHHAQQQTQQQPAAPTASRELLDGVMHGRPQQRQPPIGLAYPPQVVTVGGKPSGGGLALSDPSIFVGSAAVRVGPQHFLSQSAGNAAALHHPSQLHHLQQQQQQAAPMGHRLPAAKVVGVLAPAPSSRRGAPQPSSHDSPPAPADGSTLHRTVHVRFLPTALKQGEFAALCTQCGDVVRVRICGNNIPTDDLSWIYGFVEFATADGAHAMVAATGRTLGHNGKTSLRIKVTMAKQPIIDRVFHDGDVLKGTTSTFGCGQYAAVTLQDAVYSYFSVVNKNNLAKNLQTIIGADAGAESGCSSAAGSSKKRGLAGGTIGAAGEHGSSDSDDVQSVTPSVASESPSLMSSVTTNISTSAIAAADGFASSLHTSVVGSGKPAARVVAPPPVVTVGDPTGRPVPRVAIGGSTTATASATAALRTSVATIADEYVLQRCYTLLESAMRHGKLFAQTRVQTNFFDGLAAIRSLQEALEQHKPFRVCLAAASRSFHAQLPETAKFAPLEHLLLPASGAVAAGDATTAGGLLPLRDAIAIAVTEVCVTMNLIALCLHALRGTLADLVPFSNQILEICLSAPFTKIAPVPTTTTSTTAGDADEDDSIQFLMKVVGDAQAFQTVEAAHGRQQQVRHHTFLCQALLAVGLATEGVNPLMARCVYNLCHLRMQTTLGIDSLPALRAVLHAPTVSLLPAVAPLLKAPLQNVRPQQLQQQPVTGSASPFAEHFFTSWTQGAIAAIGGPAGTTVSDNSSLSMAHRGADGLHDVGKLPPAHCAVPLPMRR